MLFAIGSKDAYRFIFEAGEGGELFYERGLMDFVVFWNLKDNNLENQDKPTINFLHPILCLKK